MTPRTTTQPNRVIESDQLQHIQDTPDLVNAIRDGKLVQVTWNELTPEERRAAECVTFALYGGEQW